MRFLYLEIRNNNSINLDLCGFSPGTAPFFKRGNQNYPNERNQKQITGESNSLEPMQAWF